MRSREKKSVFLLLIITLNLSLIPIGVANTEYYLGFNEDAEIIWEYSYLNDTLISLLISIEDYDSSLSDNKVGDQIKWEIEDIDSYEDYWDIDYELREGSDLRKYEGEYKGDFYRYIAKDPEDLAYEWFYGDASDYTIVIIPKNARDYLEGFNNKVPFVEQDRVYVKDLTLTIDDTVDGEHDTKIITYDTDGNQENYSLYYDGDLAYQYLLEYFDPLGGGFDLSIIMIIGFIVIFSLCVAGAGVSVYRKNKKARVKSDFLVKPIYDSELSKPTPAPASAPVSAPASDFFKELDKKEAPPAPPPVITVPSTKELKVIGYCELCGEKREEDAIFCPTCGNKF